MANLARESIITTNNTGLGKFNRTHAPQPSSYLTLYKQLDCSILAKETDQHTYIPDSNNDHPHALQMICRAKVDSQYDIHHNRQHHLQRTVQELQSVNQKLMQDNQRLLEQCIRLRKTQANGQYGMGIKVENIPSGQKLELACQQLELQKLQLQAQVNELALSIIQMKHSKCLSCQVKLSKIHIKQELNFDLHDLKIVQQQIQTKLRILAHKYESSQSIGSDKSIPQECKQWEIDTTTATACHKDDDKEKQKQRINGRGNRASSGEHTKINIIDMLKSKYLNEQTKITRF